MKSAVVLLSGGLDSATCLAIAQNEGYTCYTLSFVYGQRHVIELEAAKRIATKAHVLSHQIINLEISAFSHSHLTNAELELPTFQSVPGIAPTYVPARNTVFLAYALAFAESCDAEAIFIGVSSVDYSGYPDCRPAFIEAFQKLASVATQAGVEGRPIHIKAPLMQLSKAETLRTGLTLGVDYALTISCYQANEQGEACGQCESCGLRKRGFLEAGVPDPTRYQL